MPRLKPETGAPWPSLGDAGLNLAARGFADNGELWLMLRTMGGPLLDHGHDYGYKEFMQVSKGVLKAKMLEYFRRVEETGEELIVTDNNQPVLRIVPIRKRRPAAEVFSDVRGRIVYRGDVLAPTTDEWPET